MKLKPITVEQIVHHTNLVDYVKLLKTKLTPTERAFAEQRIAEEKKALESLARKLRVK